MNVTVRLSADLANLLGRSRLTVSLNQGATVADLLDSLQKQYPTLQQGLNSAVPIIAGRHVSHTRQLSAGQEVALLRPIAGG